MATNQDDIMPPGVWDRGVHHPLATRDPLTFLGATPKTTMNHERGVNAFDVVTDIKPGDLMLGDHKPIPREAMDALAAEAFKAKQVSAPVADNVTAFGKKPTAKDAADKAHADKVAEIKADIGREVSAFEQALIEDVASVMIHREVVLARDDAEEIAASTGPYYDAIEAYADMKRPLAAGMTIRDHFAGLAVAPLAAAVMADFTASAAMKLDGLKSSAVVAYAVADAMMAARNPKPVSDKTVADKVD